MLHHNRHYTDLNLTTHRTCPNTTNICMTHRKVQNRYDEWIRTDGDETDGQDMVAASIKLASIAQTLWAKTYGLYS